MKESFPIDFRDSALGASFAVRIHPGAGATGIIGTIAGALKLAVSAPPMEDRANQEMTEFLAGLFNVPRSAVQIVTGARARNKVIRIADRTAASLELALRDHFAV